MITKYIGQIETVASLNEILEAKKNCDAKGESYAFRPLYFGGYTGTGKSNLARCFAEQLEGQGYNYIEVPPNAGMRDLYRVFGRIQSTDTETGATSAIPHVILWDEFHAQKVGVDLLKAMTTQVECVHTVTRQGFPFLYDPFNHIHIFASNQSLDKAMARRCRNYKLGFYKPNEMERLAELMLTKKHGVQLSEDGLAALMGRCKPLAGDLEELVSPLKDRAQAENINKLSGAIVTDVLKKQGFFPRGLRASDMAILNQLVNGPSTSAVLKFKCQDEKKRDTQEKIDWLCSCNLVLPVRGGFALSKGGAKYVEEIVAAQKAARIIKAKK